MGVTTMRRFLSWTLLVIPLACYGLAQDREEGQNSGPGPGRQIANGAGNIGVGAAKGAGDLGKGTAKAAGHLVTLHPVNAGISLSEGAGAAGKDVAAGTVKGAGKISAGVGRAFKRIF